MNLKLKKGAFPTFFESSDTVYNNNPAAAITPDHQYAPDNIPDQQYQTTSMLPMHMRKKLEHTEKKLSKAKNKIKVQQSRKRRADKRLVSLQEKLGNCLFYYC